MKFVLGITGGTGSGKTTVTSYLKDKGAFVVDADVVAREIVSVGMPALFEIEEALNMLGAQIVTSESPALDYVFIKLKDGVQKEPPSDDKIVRELFERRENNEIQFKILAKEFFA